MAATTGSLPAQPPESPRRLLPVLGWLALTVYYFLPASAVLDAKLDSSIFSSYAYLTAHGFQYGTDVVPLAGPLGFIMYGQVYGGDLFWARMAGELLAAGVLSTLLLWFFRSQRGSGWRWVWLAAQILLTTFIEDLPVAWTLLLAGLFLLRPVGRRNATVPATVVLGLLALFKGTDLMLSLATVAVVATAWILRRDRRQAGLIAGTYLVTLVGGWLLAGQNPGHIPAYIAGSYELSKGYNDTMGLDEPAGIFYRGAGVAAGFALLLGLSAWARRRDVLQLAAIALFAGYGFVFWKHGFVRADGHVYIFFCFIAVAILTWYLQCVAARGLPRGRFPLANQCAVAVLVVGSLYGPHEPECPDLTYYLGHAVSNFRLRLVQLVAPVSAKAELETRLQTQRELQALPQTRELIGPATVDFFGYQQGVIPLNGLNYHPRPMGGGAYSACNRFLMELNRDFVRDATRRPAYYLVKLQTIDHRLTTLDDGLALQELLRSYRPVAVEQDILVLGATPGEAAPYVMRSLDQRTVHFGERVPVPTVADNEIVLARFHLQLNWLGRLRSLFYKTPAVWAELSGDRISSPLRRRVLPAMADQAFILSPVLEDNGDFLELYAHSPGKKLDSFQIQTDRQKYFLKDFSVGFFAVPRPAVSAAVGALLPFLRTPVEPVKVAGPSGPAREILAYSLQPPGAFSFNLDGNEREFSFTFGLRPEAVTIGRTDGVVFIVELESPAGTIREVFRRWVNPVAQPADRGPQTARVDLPLFPAGSRLNLRTDPGPNHDGGWDWSYVTDMKFARGPFRLGQFPGFNRVPGGVEAENASAVDLAGRPVFLLHAPGRLLFPLAGRETRLALEFGLLPGAYDGPAGTDGADFVVEVQHADHTRTELFHRALRPRTLRIDRGPQQATLALSGLAAGDTLIVRTTTGPADDKSWDWTYLSSLTLE